VPQLLDRPATSCEEIPARAGLLMQLALIAGNEPASSFIEVRCLHPDGRPGPREFVPVRDPRRAIELVARLRDRCEVLLGVAPRTSRAGTASAVERVWALRVDCDTPESGECLRLFRPEPSIVLGSGTAENVHGYFALSEPMPPTWARAANLRLAHALGSDAAVADTPRVMRAIGSLNHKHDPPVPVSCRRLELDVFTCDEVVGSLPDPPVRRPPPRRAPGSTVAPSAALEGLQRTVREARPGGRNAALHWAACRLRDHAGEGLLDVEDGREALREAALDAGLGEYEIEATIASGLASGGAS
jgi:hypothetical protein